MDTDNNEYSLLPLDYSHNLEEIILHHNIDEIKTFITQHKIDINKPSYSLNTRPLRHAILSNSIEKINFLLNIGAEINASLDNHGNTAIMFCLRKDTEIVQLLLNRGAEIYKQTTFTPKSLVDFHRTMYNPPQPLTEVLKSHSEKINTFAEFIISAPSNTRIDTLANLDFESNKLYILQNLDIAIMQENINSNDVKYVLINHFNTSIETANRIIQNATNYFYKLKNIIINQYSFVKFNTYEVAGPLAEYIDAKSIKNIFLANIKFKAKN